MHILKMTAVSTAIALSASFASRPAYANTTTTVSWPGPNDSGAYCSIVTYGITQVDGEHLNVVAYGYGLGWSNGACNGSGAPEGGDVIEVMLQYSTDNQNWSNSGYLTESKSTNDVFGLYVASVPGGVLSGDTISYTQLNGPGYYRLVIYNWVEYETYYWQGGEAISNSIYANLARPPR